MFLNYILLYFTDRVFFLPGKSRRTVERIARSKSTSSNVPITKGFKKGRGGGDHPLGTDRSTDDLVLHVSDHEITMRYQV